MRRRSFHTERPTNGIVYRKRSFAVSVLLILLQTGLAAAKPVGQSQTEIDGNLCRDLRDPQRAITACSAIIEATARPQNNIADVFVDRGSGYVQIGDYDRAFQDFDQAIGLDPSSSEAYDKRGRAHFQQKDYVQALRDLDQAVRLNPNSFDA